MQILKKGLSLVLAGILVLGLCVMPVSAETHHYLYEDFEADDFINTDLSITAPTHSGGSSVTMLNHGIDPATDSLVGLETETVNGVTNTYLRYKTQGKGTWQTAFAMYSEDVKNSPTPIYDYTVSYDMTMDEWSHVDAEGNVIDHSSRYMHMHFGGWFSPTAKIYDSIMQVCTEDGANTWVTGGDRALVRMWDTATGKGEKHNYRWVFHKGNEGEGRVDLYIDGICVIDNGFHVAEAVPLPSDGRYFGIRGDDNSGGALRVSVKLDNIRLEYDKAAVSEVEPFGDGQLKALNGRLNTKQESVDNGVKFTHVYNYDAVNNESSAKTMKAILAAYDGNNMLVECAVSDLSIPANSKQQGSVMMTHTVGFDNIASYDVRAYIWTGDYKPRDVVIGYQWSEVDWALANFDAQLFDGDKMLNWLASLYDPATGSFFYSESSRDNPDQFGPHLESLYGAGLPKALMRPDALRAMGTWVQNLQDPATGFFIEPEFDLADASTGKKGRDNQYAQGILSELRALGYSQFTPLYPTVEERAQGTQTQEAQLMASTDANGNGVEDFLESWTGVENWLNSMDWTEGSVWGSAHATESYSSILISLGYKQKIAEFFSKMIHPDTGFMCGKKQFNWSTFKYEWVADPVKSYMSISGALKASWAFGEDSIPYPYINKLFDNALPMAEANMPPDMSEIINLPVLMQGAMRSYAASGNILPEGIQAKLDEITPKLIQAITVQMKPFLKDSGAFGYIVGAGQSHTQGAHVATGEDEADVNGNGLATRCRTILYEFAGRPCPALWTQQEYADKINKMWDEYHGIHGRLTADKVTDWNKTDGYVPMTKWAFKED